MIITSVDGEKKLTSNAVTTALGYTPYNSTNPSGYITGITSSDVTTALGYTPYNSTNPSGYVTSSDVHNVPSGGTAGQVLTKNSGTDYDARWASSGGSVTVTQLTPTLTQSSGTLTFTIDYSSCVTAQVMHIYIYTSYGSGLFANPYVYIGMISLSESTAHICGAEYSGDMDDIEVTINSSAHQITFNYESSEAYSIKYFNVLAF